MARGAAMEAAQEVALQEKAEEVSQILSDHLVRLEKGKKRVKETLLVADRMLREARASMSDDLRSRGKDCPSRGVKEAHSLHHRVEEVDGQREERGEEWADDAVRTAQVEPATPAEQMEGKDKLALIKIQALRATYISSKPEDFNALAQAVHLTNSPVSTVALVKQVLSSGCDVNDGGACGWPPLSLALLRGDAYIDTVHLLLEGHADVEGSPMNLATTPLLLAAATRQEACLNALLHRTPSIARSPRVDHDGRTVLMLCARWLPDATALRACRLLVSKGADVTARHTDGRQTAFDFALDEGNEQTAAWLLGCLRSAQTLAQTELLEGQQPSPSTRRNRQRPRKRGYAPRGTDSNREKD